MKIGIDVSPIVYGTGVSIYTKNLVENLLNIDQENEYTLFFSSLRRKFPSLSVTGYEFRAIRIPPTILDILWNKLHILPVETFVGDVDVFHCSDWTQPPARKAKLVTTIHDLSFLRWPKTAHPKVLKAQKKRLKWVEKEADAVIAISQATKNEIVELTDIPEKKITVIYEDVSEDVKKFKSDQSPASRQGGRIANLKEKYKIEGKYIMAIGSQAPRKNIEMLVKAFLNVQSSNVPALNTANQADRQIFKKLHLVIAGRYEAGEDLPEGVIATGFLDREELLELINHAEAFIYPSLYEGFGLPILEAFSLQTPVVTSNCSSMAEIADNSAVLVDPKSVESIAKGIKTIVNDKGLQKDLTAKGSRRLNDFSWKKTAEQTLKVYKHIAD